MHPALIELIPYFTGAFGNGTRIDYGSGHELSFLAWLCCLDLIGYFTEIDYPALITRVFAELVFLFFFSLFFSLSFYYFRSVFLFPFPLLLRPNMRYDTKLLIVDI